MKPHSAHRSAVCVVADSWQAIQQRCWVNPAQGRLPCRKDESPDTLSWHLGEKVMQAKNPAASNPTCQ
jgi:hypothetical protein